MTRIVPMPSFTDPHLPEAAGGSINFGVAPNFPPYSAHPVEHAESYGALFRDDAREETPGEDREDWKKDQWQELAAEYGLPTSGTKDELIASVEDYEATLGEGGESDRT